MSTINSRTLRVVRAAAFEGGKKIGLSISRHEFLTYCELREGQCIVMMHVPELRRFKADAKDSLATLAWGMTQSALRRQNAGTPDMKVLVGLRGIALYDRVLQGVYVADAVAQGSDLKETVKGRDVLEAAKPGQSCSYSVLPSRSCLRMPAVKIVVCTFSRR